MKNLILALSSANLTESVMESVLTEFDIWIDSKINRSEQKMTSQFIAPIQKENDSIRTELRILTETVKHGFEKMDQKWEERFKYLDQKWEERFLRSDEKLEFFRKSLEIQIISNKENLETNIKAIDKQLSLMQRLLWLLLTLVLGMFAKVVHLI
jgi:hypothetical protein